MNVLEQIDESTRRVMACVSEECGISSKRSLQVIASRVREALYHEHRLEEECERIRDGYFHEAWFAVASLKGLVAVIGEETGGVPADRFRREAEALRSEILELAETAQKISPGKLPAENKTRRSKEAAA